MAKKLIINENQKYNISDIDLWKHAISSSFDPFISSIILFPLNNIKPSETDNFYKNIFIKNKSNELP